MGYMYLGLLALQILAAVHAVKTGRETFWIYIIVFVPVIGIAVYVLTQVLPDLRNSPGSRRAAGKLGKVVNPNRDLHRLRDQLQLSDNIQNRLQLADECFARRIYGEAETLYQGCLRGPTEDDPHILLKIAKSQSAQEKHEQALATLEQLIAAQPNFRSHDGHLLYAKSLLALGREEEALTEFAALADAYPGEEARVLYAQLLQKLGRTEEAVAQYEQTVVRARRAPKYYRRKEKQWISIAETALRN